MARVISLHEQVHQETDAALEFRREADATAAANRFESVRRLRNEWLDQLADRLRRAPLLADARRVCSY